MRRVDPIKKEPQIPPYARQRPLRRASPRRVLLPETETESSRRHALREAGFPLHGDGLARLDPDLASLSWKTRPSIRGIVNGRHGWRSVKDLAKVLLALQVASCARVAPPPFAPPTADAALTRMHASLACGNAIQASAKVDHFGEGGRVRADVLLFA